MELTEICQRFLNACQRIGDSWSLEEGTSGLADMVMRGLLAPKSVAIVLVGDDGSALKIVGSRGLSGGYLNHHCISADEPIVEKLMGGGEDVCLDFGIDNPECGSLRLETAKGSLVATPILSMHRSVGFIVATSAEAGHFDELHMILLKLAARLAGACHDRCLLYEQRRKYMAIDPATGLWSYEFFCSRLDEEIARCRRQKNPLSLILVDIDGFLRFRQINGSEAADSLFTRFVEVTRTAVRGIDVMGRFGLDELMVALPQTDLRGAEKAAERIRDAIEKSDLPKAPKAVTASIGASTLHEGEQRSGGMIERAKRALYDTYVKGGNCVCAEGFA
jgi:diguanylate cyclase (GGDEF)-like protein